MGRGGRLGGEGGGIDGERKDWEGLLENFNLIIFCDVSSGFRYFMISLSFLGILSILVLL